METNKPTVIPATKDEEARVAIEKLMKDIGARHFLVAYTNEDGEGKTISSGPDSVWVIGICEIIKEERIRRVLAPRPTNKEQLAELLRGRAAAEAEAKAALAKD